MTVNSAARVTSSDVARRAKVSTATVSYVLNDAPGQKISEHTRQVVLEAARDLRYRPNEAARRLASGRSRIVLLIVPHVRLGEIVIEMVSALTSELARRDLTLSVHFDEPDAEKPDVAELATRLDASAVMYISPLSESALARLEASGIRALALLGRVDSPAAVINRRIGEMQVEHLAQQGHRNIAYARSDIGLLDVFRLGREDGARDSAASQGLSALQVGTLATSGANAAEVIQRWHSAGVTAIAAYNDDVAFVALHGVLGAGLRCPDDIAVIGVDDVTAGQVSVPPLTTIKTLSAHWAAIALATLRHALDDPEAGVEYPSGPAAELVRREST